MATTKKATIKKSPAKKTTPTRRKTTTTKTKTKQTKPASFHLSRNDTPFLTIAITRQTLYWGILSLVVLVMGLWIIHLQNEINKIYDAIEANNSSASSSYHAILKNR